MTFRETITQLTAYFAKWLTDLYHTADVVLPVVSLHRDTKVFCSVKRFLSSMKKGSDEAASLCESNRSNLGQRNHHCFFEFFSLSNQKLPWHQPAPFASKCARKLPTFWLACLYQQAIPPCVCRFGDIYCRECPFIRQFTIQYHLAVTGTFKFFEYHFIHTRPGLNQRGSDNGQ